ncbi:MAG: IS91 family transposase [Limisphaerales bacterium]
MRLYRTRNPRRCPLWQCANRHFDDFYLAYPSEYQTRYGPLRPIISEVVRKFLDCGNLDRGFARIRCDHCQHESLLAFSCKSRWFCPSCHQKNVQNTAGTIVERVLAPVPHRHYVLALPKMLRPYFLRHRPLLKHLCNIANQSISEYFRAALDLKEGSSALVLTLHTFGEYLDFHPHIHALVADGLFTRDGWFHCLPELPIKPLEEVFRAKIIQLLVQHHLLSSERVQVLLSWKHTGFNVHCGDPVPPQNKAQLEGLAQYILRNPFSVTKMTMESPTDMIIYRSRLNAKINRNFQVFTPTDFLAAITCHIPDKGAQMVRYYGWYSNKMRGQRHRAQHDEPPSPLRQASAPPPPVKIPCKRWRDVIQKVWHTDPLLCPKCGKGMRVIAVIDQPEVVERILRHLGMWSGGGGSAVARPPPQEWTREPCDDIDPMPDYENVLSD